MTATNAEPNPPATKTPTPSRVHRPCPVCGADDFQDLRQHDEWRLVRCNHCQLAYLPEVPTEEAVETEFDWSDTFAEERRQRWRRYPLMRAWGILVFAIKPNRAKRAFRKIARHAAPPPGRFLDLGCGDGRLAAVAQTRGYDVSGIELSPHMARRAARRIGRENIIVSRLENADLPPASLDTVTAISFLEHDHTPHQTLQILHRTLKPGGLLVIKVPNYASLLRKWLGNNWSGYRWPDHVQYFTPDTLAELARRTNFSVVAVSANPLSDNFWLFARPQSPR